MGLRGKLKILASADLGDLGPVESEPVFCNWPLARLLLSVLPWLLLLGLLLSPPNRNARAWTVLLPVAGLYLFACLMVQNPFVQEGPWRDFIVFYQQMAMGLGVLWLGSSILAGRKPVFAFPLAALVLALTTDLFILTGYGFRFIETPTGGLFWWLPSVEALAVICALILGGLFSRRRYTPARFTLWAVFWLLVGNAAAIAVYLRLEMWALGAWSPTSLAFRVWLEWIPIVMVGSSTILLPFLLLTYHNRLYRDRFYAIFRLTDAAEPLADVVAAPKALAK